MEVGGGDGVGVAAGGDKEGGEERVREKYYEGEGLGLGVIYPKFA